MYLKHGFLQSAAMEWMAVCETSPDVRALLGLARVAHANGQLDDAAVFAGEVAQGRSDERRRAGDPRRMPPDARTRTTRT